MIRANLVIGQHFQCIHFRLIPLPQGVTLG
ncbi:MAG: hypothetical protein QOK48_703 [Blastocatellia bacterium]|jgi:hypothetical protein|nr:hypothetical protein [Blastocatellia bacterium]